MSTLVYSPGIQIRIATAKHGIIDVSEDCVSGGIVLSENALHTFNFALLNQKRKYDGVFTPMDRISIRMKRLRWMQIMSGYLTKVPHLTAFPGSVQVTGECSLKRLKNYFWDPGTTHSQLLLGDLQSGLGAENDQGLKDLFVRLVTDVTDWPAEKIHVADIPGDWFSAMKPVLESVEYETARAMQSNAGTIFSGGSINKIGTTRHPDFDESKKIGYLPDTSGMVTWFGGPKGGAYGSRMNLWDSHGALPDNRRPGPLGPWFCAMRWPYFDVHNKWAISDTATRNESQNWWRFRKILAFCPRTNRAVCVGAADWGPRYHHTGDAKHGRSDGDRVLDLSETAFNALGAVGFDQVQVRFAPDNMDYGPVSPEQWQQATVQDFLDQADSPLANLLFGGGASSNNKTAGSGFFSSITDKITGAITGGAALNSGQPGGVKFEPNPNPPVGPGTTPPHVWAAWQFITESFGATIVDARAGRGNTSDHPTGHALDIGGTRETLDKVAYWFAENPNYFDTKYVIWWDSVITPTDTRGWREYNEGALGRGSTVTTRHEDHVHLSFRDTGRTSPGTMGGAPNNNWVSRFGSEPGNGPGAPLVQASSLPGSIQAAPSSDQLQGPLALMNDSPFLEDLDPLIKASMRSFCSAPNGDLIAWFPDYFNNYGVAGSVVVRDIELLDLKISWSDDRMKTHQFVSGSNLGFGASGVGSSVGLDQQAIMKGIASIDFPQILAALFGTESIGDAINLRKRILKRFGARQQFVPKSVLASGGPAEFWYAVFLFMENWANMFSASINLTFMPELYPGMLIEVPSFNLRMYVKQVSHQWDFGGGGFTTSITATAPSRLDGGGPLNLPEALR